jgi:hypothetical protein
VTSRLSASVWVVGYGNRCAVKLGALILDPHEKFAQKGSQDEPGQNIVLGRKSDGDTKQRQVVGKVGGAVQRINDPAAAAARMDAALFSKDGMIGKHPGDRVDDGRFRSDVRFGDQIDGPFFTDRSQISIMFLQDLAALAGSGDSHAFDLFHFHKLRNLQILCDVCQPNCRQSDGRLKMGEIGLTLPLHNKMRKLSLRVEMINKRHDFILCSGFHQGCSPRRNDNFLIFSPCRESRRKPDPALPGDRSKELRLHPWRLGSDSLRLLQR